jgi:nucleoside-diphosphate-sugar epimerase
MVTRSIEGAQRKVEARNFDIRKQLLEFDNVANEQRKVIYQQRNEILDSVGLQDQIDGMRQSSFTDLVHAYVPPGSLEEQWNLSGLEQVLADVHASAPGQWRLARLRYFNPVGAHPSGLIGEDPQGTPNNLMPYVAQVAAGERAQLSVFGNDYPTPDGTGLRDYIHVCDLAEGHVAALAYLRQHPGLLTVNLGTGRPVSVLEMVRGLEQASGRSVPYQIAPRRAGDVAACWADPSLAEQLLGWRAQRDVSAMCQDAWRWQSSAARNAA